MSETVIALDQLSKRFRGQVTPAVDDLTLEVRQGEVFGFLGPNGAGKTTTIRVLLDLLRPTAGRVELFGKEVSGKTAQIRSRIGYLPGDMTLYRQLTGRALLQYLAKLKGSIDWAYVDSLAERFEVDLDRQVQDLSRGNRQKVGLIQACMSQPELLILDEPTSGLDPLKQREFRVLLREFAEAGRTVFLSSHALGEVEQIVDRVAIIREGKLVVVEEIERLKEKAVHRMEITFAGEPPVEQVRSIAGVRDLTVLRNTLEFSIVGSFEQLIDLLAGKHVTNFVSREVDLEEIFLAYYRGDGVQQ